MSGWRAMAAAVLFMLAAYFSFFRPAQMPQAVDALRDVVAAEGVFVWTEAP